MLCVGDIYDCVWYMCGVSMVCVNMCMCMMCIACMCMCIVLCMYEYLIFLCVRGMYLCMRKSGVCMHMYVYSCVMCGFSCPCVYM